MVRVFLKDATMELKVRNVNDGISEVLWRFKTSAVRENSRNGPVLVLPEPLLLTYNHPRERILFWPERDANVFFHIMECLWMMAGRNDTEFVKYFSTRMGQFSDDGETLNGAYGHRWRSRFGVDQLPIIIRELTANPNSRRAVLTMWGAQEDLNNLGSKDVCCNTQAYFDLRGGHLNMTVLNRSNDVIWGMLGANAVHFSFLQEFIAAAVGVPVGVYRQFTNNAHIYTELYDYVKYVESPPDSEQYDAYRSGVRPRRIVDNSWSSWLRDCEKFCRNPFDVDVPYAESFFTDVARPLALAYRDRKERIGSGLYWIEKIRAEDIKLAAQQWVMRRAYAKTT